MVTLIIEYRGLFLIIRNFFNKYNFLVFLYVGFFCYNVCASTHQITSDIFTRHSDPFASYVLGFQSKLAPRKVWGGEWVIIRGAKFIGCDDTAIACMKISYGLFDRKKEDIQALCRAIDLDFANTILEKYHSKPGDMNRLARISHAEHIKRITLPQNVNKAKLIENPEEYKKLIDQKQVNPDELDGLVISSLFVRYCVENNVK